MLLYTDKIFSIYMYAQTGDNQVCTLEAPSKSLNKKCMNKKSKSWENYAKRSEAEKFLG